MPRISRKEFGLADWNTLSAKIQAGSDARTNTSTTRGAAPKPLTDGVTMPVVPLRDIVIFPQMAIPLVIGREKSIRAVLHATATGSRLVGRLATDGCGFQRRAAWQ